MKLRSLLAFASAYFRTRRHLRLSPRALERLQARLFRRLVKRIVPRSPWLSTIFSSTLRLQDLAAQPVLDKRAVLDHFSTWNVLGIDEAQALTWGNDQERSRQFSARNGLSVGLSTGTTGRRGIFLTTADERLQWAGSVLGKFLPGFWRHRHRIALFLRSNSPLYETLGSSILQFRYFDLTLPLPELLNELEHYQPTVLFGPPSVLEAVARAVLQQVVTIKPTLVISGADVLEPATKALVERALAVSVRQIYQATEGFLAFTCGHGRLHLNEDSVHFERQPLPGEGRFVPIITDLRRTTQPVVHYRLNDVLVDDASPCPCGCAFRVISAIEGREDDVLCWADASGRAVAVFPDLVRRAVAEAAPALEDYRVVQTRTGLTLYADQGPVLQEALASLLRERAVPVPPFTLVPYQALPLDRKRRRVSREFSLPEGFWESVAGGRS